MEKTRRHSLYNQLPILVLLQSGGRAVWGWLGVALLQRQGNGAAVGARAAA